MMLLKYTIIITENLFLSYSCLIHLGETKNVLMSILMETDLMILQLQSPALILVME